MPSKLPQLNVRLEQRIFDLVARLCEETGLSQAGVITQALGLLARREGVPTTVRLLERKSKKSQKPA